MTARHPLQVFVVDEHPVVRVGVCDVLERTGDYEVVAEASSVLQALLRISALPGTTRFLITDVRLRGECAFDLIRAARQREPRMEVILLTSRLNGCSLRRALHDGARGFVPKEAEGGAVLEALRCAEDGHVYLDPRLTGSVVEAICSPGSVDRQVSEERLLQLLAGGLSDRDISRATGRPPGVISREVSMLRRRLGVPTRAAAVTVAMRRGMIA